MFIILLAYFYMREHLCNKSLPSNPQSDPYHMVHMLPVKPLISLANNIMKRRAADHLGNVDDSINPNQSKESQ